MSSCSLDLRKRIVKAHIEQSQIRARWQSGVSRWSAKHPEGAVERFRKRAEAGCLAAAPHPGSKPRLDEAQCQVLGRQVERHNDWTLEQHTEASTEATGGCSKSRRSTNTCVSWELAAKEKPLCQGARRRGKKGVVRAGYNA